MNFANQWNYFVALGPQAILTVFAIGILLIGVNRQEENTNSTCWNLGWIALMGVLSATIMNGILYTVVKPSYQGIVAVDGYSILANWVLLIGLAMAILISVGYVDRQRLQAPEYFCLLLFSTIGLMLMTASLDLILIFIGLEIASISVYALAAIDQRSPRGAEAGLKYFLLGAFSTGIFLYGVALIYGATSSVNLLGIEAAVAAGTSSPAMLLTGVIMLAVGFCFKVSVVPFHMWTPDVYQGAPLPITGYMSVAIKVGAFLTFFRVFGVYLDGLHESWSGVFWWLAVITMISGNLIALTQNNIKRLLAYSGIAHSGYLLITLQANNPTSESGLLFYLTVYSLANLGLFAGMIFVANQGETKVEIDNYAGLGVKYPFVALSLTLFLFSLAGFPGTGGFIGKVLILRGALEEHYIGLSLTLVLGTLISYWYYLRIAWFMWMKDPANDPLHDTSSTSGVPVMLRVVLIFAFVLIIYTGLFPSQWIDLMEAVTLTV